MRPSSTIAIASVFLLTFAACNDFVQNIEAPINSVDDLELNSQDQVPFVVKGVKARFNNTLDGLTLRADALSDAFVFDGNVPGATFITLHDIDNGEIALDNADVDIYSIRLGELRLFADTLITRVSDSVSDRRIVFTDPTIRQDALYNGYLYGGIARYWLASYFGLSPDQGGGVIAKGPFVPSGQMYADALDHFDKALVYAESDYDRRVVNSLIARIHLIEGDYVEAAAAAANGLMEGDDPMQGLYTTEVNNDWWVDAGAGRVQVVPDLRFAQYIADDSAEASRIPLAPITGLDGSTVYIQNKYPEQNSPLPFISWQENSLMLAETGLRSGDSAGALAQVNSVRGSHGLRPLASVDLDSLYIERDKELFATGSRLIDEHRFNRWHLPEGKWMYLPIDQRERNVNPNF